MIKEVLVDGRLDYLLGEERTKKGTLYSLYYSSDELWTNPGELIMTLLDNGDCIKVSKFRKTGQIDYDEQLQLSILLRASLLSQDYKIEIITDKKEL